MFPMIAFHFIIFFFFLFLTKRAPANKVYGGLLHFNVHTRQLLQERSAGLWRLSRIRTAPLCNIGRSKSAHSILFGYNAMIKVYIVAANCQSI